MMKKNSTKGYVILGILFALVSVVVFAIPVVKLAAFWIAYAFTAVAFAVQIVIWKATLGKEKTLKSKFLGFPIVHIGLVYLALQVAALGVFRFAGTLPAWSAVVACSVIAGVSAVCVISADVGRGEIERVEEQVREKVFYIRQLQTELELMAEREAAVETKAALARLAEKLRFSDPMSDESLAEIETQIATKISELKTAEDKASRIHEIGLLLDERNRKCKNRK